MPQRDGRGLRPGAQRRGWTQRQAQFSGRKAGRPYAAARPAGAAAQQAGPDALRGAARGPRSARRALHSGLAAGRLAPRGRRSPDAPACRDAATQPQGEGRAPLSRAAPDLSGQRGQRPCPPLLCGARGQRGGPRLRARAACGRRADDVPLLPALRPGRLSRPSGTPGALARTPCPSPARRAPLPPEF